MIRAFEEEHPIMLAAFGVGLISLTTCLSCKILGAGDKATAVGTALAAIFSIGVPSMMYLYDLIRDQLSQPDRLRQMQRDQFLDQLDQLREQLTQDQLDLLDLLDLLNQLRLGQKTIQDQGDQLVDRQNQLLNQLGRLRRQLMQDQGNQLLDQRDQLVDQLGQLRAQLIQDQRDLLGQLGQLNQLDQLLDQRDQLPDQLQLIDRLIVRLINRLDRLRAQLDQGDLLIDQLGQLIDQLIDRLGRLRAPLIQNQGNLLGQPREQDDVQTQSPEPVEHRTPTTQDHDL